MQHHGILYEHGGVADVSRKNSVVQKSKKENFFLIFCRRNAGAALTRVYMVHAQQIGHWIWAQISIGYMQINIPKSICTSRLGVWVITLAGKARICMVQQNLYITRSTGTCNNVVIWNFVISSHLEVCRGYTRNLKAVCWIANVIIPEFVISRFDCICIHIFSILLVIMNANVQRLHCVSREFTAIYLLSVMTSRDIFEICWCTVHAAHDGLWFSTRLGWLYISLHLETLFHISIDRDDSGYHRISTILITRVLIGDGRYVWDRCPC